MNQSNGVSTLKRDYPGIELDAVALSLHLKEQFSGLLNEELSRLIAERAIAFLDRQPRCPCCGSTNVTLESNQIARWVACHNPPCGLTHHVSMHPELARFFEKEKQL